MSARTKLTPFARMFIFLIIFLPLAYFGAAYYNNEDPLQSLRNIFQKEQPAANNRDSQTYDGQSEVERLRAENARLQRRIQELEAQLEQFQDSSESGSNRQPWGNN